MISAFRFVKDGFISYSQHSQFSVVSNTQYTILRPITTGANSAMNQSELQTIIHYLLNARENWRVQGAMGFGLAFHWLKNWREIFKPISKRSNRKLRFSNDCRKTKTKAITPTNHNRSRQRDEPITVPSNYL